MKQYNWACIGCGHIANEMAQALAEKGRRFYAVASRTKANADTFAARYGIERVYDSVDALLADDAVDIVYIATPHNRHIAYILQAAAAKKHILCEKAITLNSSELSRAMTACEENGVILAEAMTIYHMPVFKQMSDYLQDGALGRLKLIEVNLGSSKDYDMTNRFFNPALAGGAMLDIGVYALSFVRYFLSENATLVKSAVKLAPTGVDEQAVLLLSNSKDEMASVTLSLTARLPRTGVVSFEHGYVTFENYNRSRRATVTLLNGEPPVVFESEDGVSPLGYEIDDMEQAVSGGADLMYTDYTADVMDIMTNARREWGVRYPEETTA